MTPTLNGFSARYAGWKYRLTSVALEDGVSHDSLTRMARQAQVVRLSSKGQLVIPVPLRRQLGLKTGQALVVRSGPHRQIVLSPAGADSQGLEMMLRRARSWAGSRRRDLVEELHERRRRERERGLETE